jgi:hypothetical protein
MNEEEPTGGFLEAVMDSSSETRHWLISFGKPFSSGISEEEMAATPRLR